jgi:hypothetical protein
MHRCLSRALLLGALAGASVSPLAWVEASTMKGTAVDIPAIDDATKTADSQARGGLGKLFVYAMLAGGGITFLSGYHGAGLTTAGVGVGSAFFPAIGSSVVDNASPASSLAATLTHTLAWWDPIRLLHDPLFWGMLVLVFCAHEIRQWSFAHTRKDR